MRTTLDFWGLAPKAYVRVCLVVCNLAPPGSGRTPLESLMGLVAPKWSWKCEDLEGRPASLPLGLCKDPSLCAQPWEAQERGLGQSSMEAGATPWILSPLLTPP